MTSLNEAMCLTLLIGAAVHDGTTEQRQQLRDRVVPEMHGHYTATGDESGVRSIIAEVMGPAWCPPVEFAAQIAVLGG